MTPVRIIVVGLGARAQYWLRVIEASADCIVVGLVDPSPAVLEQAMALCPGATGAPDLAEITRAVEADAVLLVTPPGGRLRQIESACAAGLAILAEKPLADTVAEAARFVRMTEAAGVPLMVGLNFRFLGVTDALRGLLDQGTVGKPEFVRFTYERWRNGKLPHLNKYPLTMPQPMLWEQSVHHFDLMRYVYQTEPVRVYAKTFNPSWSMYANDANVFAIFEFENGLTLDYVGTWASNWARLDFEWRTECTDGVIIQGDMFGEIGYARRDDQSLSKIDLPIHEPWITDATALLASFVSRVRGSTAPICTGRDHLRSLLMLEACVTSSRRKQALEISEIADGLITVN